MTNVVFRPVTANQVSFIRTLERDRVLPVGRTQADLRMFSFLRDVENTLRPIDVKEASELISWLKKLPKKNDPSASLPPAQKVDASPGMYIAKNGTIVRVYKGQRTGNLLCKKVVQYRDGSYHYVYLGTARKWIRGSIRRMTLEEAKKWGKMSGTCCVCARRLDVPESVEAGIGPVCAKRV